LKRSQNIRLILISGISAGALAGCSPSAGPPVSTTEVYTNNYFVPGAGYYHAPFRAWFALPYNHFDPQTRQYYCGGAWASAPFASITNLSSPTPQAVGQTEAVRTDVSRGGFGGTSSGGYFFSS
jgi:hypothetical protein